MYRESGTVGCAESGAEGGAVSPPASARPAENVGGGRSEGVSEYRGWGGVGWEGGCLRSQCVTASVQARGQD